MRRTDKSAIVILLLATLAACGGTPATTAPQVLTNPTATVAPTTAPTAAPPAPSAAPALTATPAPAAPSSGPTATPRAAAPSGAPGQASSPVPTAPSATTPKPNGPIPPGWKVYVGPRAFPFVVAYPPDWTVDDGLLPEQRIVYFYGPGGRDDAERIDLEISQTGTGADIDVQRDEFFHEESQFCDQKGIEYTEHRRISGAAFAILGATCDSSNELTFMQVASGLTGGDEWNILMRTYYDRKEARLREVFDPMLTTLNIYGQAP
jgi:hypothetical protein